MKNKVLIALSALLVSELVICAKLSPNADIFGKSRSLRHEYVQDKATVASSSSENMLPSQGGNSVVMGANGWPKLFNFHQRGVKQQQQKLKAVPHNYNEANVMDLNSSGSNNHQNEALAISLSDYERLIKSGADVQFSADGQKLELIPRGKSLNYQPTDLLQHSPASSSNNSGNTLDQLNELQLASAALSVAYTPKFYSNENNRALMDRGATIKRDRVRSGLMTMLRQLASDEEVDYSHFNQLIDYFPQEQAFQSALHSLFHGPGEAIAINRFFTAILENGRAMKRIRRMNHLVGRLMANFSTHLKKQTNNSGRPTINHHRRPIRQEYKEPNESPTQSSSSGTTILNGRRFKMIPLVDYYGIATGAAAGPEVGGWIKAGHMQEQLQHSINNNAGLKLIDANQHFTGRFANRFLNRTTTPIANSVATLGPNNVDQVVVTRAPIKVQANFGQNSMFQPQLGSPFNHSEGACYYYHQQRIHHGDQLAMMLNSPAENMKQTTASPQLTLAENSTLAYQSALAASLSINNHGNYSSNNQTNRPLFTVKMGEAVVTTLIPTREPLIGMEEATTMPSISSVVIYASTVGNQTNVTSSTKSDEPLLTPVNNGNKFEAAREQPETVNGTNSGPPSSAPSSKVMIMQPVEASTLISVDTMNNFSTTSMNHKSADEGRGQFTMTADFNIELNSTKFNDSDNENDGHVVIETKQPFSIQPLLSESLSFTREINAKENASQELMLSILNAKSEAKNKTKVSQDEPVIIELDENSIAATDAPTQGREGAARDITSSSLSSSSPNAKDDSKMSEVNDDRMDKGIRTSGQQIIRSTVSKYNSKLYGKSITDSIEDLQTSHSEREFWPEET